MNIIHHIIPMDIIHLYIYIYILYAVILNLIETDITIFLKFDFEIYKKKEH